MNVFDIIGPVMIGPSSSHTAGAARIGYIAASLLESEPVKAQIFLHGSFAKTYKGHGTDKALISGIMGMKPDDKRIRLSPTLANKKGIDIKITTGHIENAHPNTALITLTDANGKEVSVQGASIGGGYIIINKVNGLPVEITGQYATFIVLHNDTPGIIAKVTETMAYKGINICNFHLAREERGGVAIMTIEVDGHIDSKMNMEIQNLPNIINSTLLIPN